MPAEFRPARPEELRRLAEVDSTCFGEALGEFEWKFFQRTTEPRLTMAAFVGDQLVGSSRWMPLELAVPGARIQAAGVTSVGVLPTHRRRGLLRGMMERLLEGLRSQGVAVALLWASEGGIYRRFGYGPAATALQVGLDRPRQGLIPLPPSGSLRMLDREEALGLLPPIHDRFLDQRPGVVGRGPALWEMALADDDPEIPAKDAPLFLCLHDGRDGPDGYLTYRLRPGGDPVGHTQTLLVQEMVGLTPQVVADLWRFCLEVDLVRRVEAARTGMRPSDDPLLWLLADPQAVEVGVRTSIWARLLDVASFLETRRYQEDGEVTFLVDDGEGSQSGTFRLRARGGAGECLRVDSGPELSLGISELSSACLGRRCLARLAGVGRIQELAQGAAARADRLLGWDPPPWCFQEF